MTGNVIAKQHSDGILSSTADAAPVLSDGERLRQAVETIQACRLRLATAWSEARKYDGTAGTAGDLRDALAAANALIGRQDVARAEIQLADLKRPATRREIAGALAGLVAAFPNAAKKELQIYGRLLAKDVSDAAPSCGALGHACTILRRTSRFLPAISEVLEAIRSAEELQRSAPMDGLRTMIKIAASAAEEYGTTVPLIDTENRNHRSSL